MNMAATDTQTEGRTLLSGFTVRQIETSGACINVAVGGG